MRARWAWVVACVGLALVAALAPTGNAAASDFWDAIRGAALKSGGSGHASPQLTRARAALAAGHADQAFAELAPLLSRAPELIEPEVLLVLGRTQSAAGSDYEALLTFERAIAAHGDAPLRVEDDALAVARLALRTQRFTLATQALIGRAELSATPSKRAALHTLSGHMLQATGPLALERAIAAYRAALLAVPEHTPALLGLALAMHRQGAREAALAIARRIRDPALIEQGLLENLQPRTERSARAALWRQSIADTAAARSAWQAAAQDPGPWQAHARETLQKAFAP